MDLTAGKVRSRSAKWAHELACELAMTRGVAAVTLAAERAERHGGRVVSPAAVEISSVPVRMLSRVC